MIADLLLEKDFWEHLTESERQVCQQLMVRKWLDSEPPESIIEEMSSKLDSEKAESLRSAFEKFKRREALAARRRAAAAVIPAIMS